MADSNRPRLNEQPPRRLLSWGITWEGEPHKRQQSVWITVWVPGELGHWELQHYWETRHLTRLAEYIEEHLGFMVYRSAGWSGGGSSLPEHVQELAHVSLPVRAKEVRAALAAQ